MIDLRGGGCEKCGYKKNLAALEFHHKDPSKKESKLDARALSNSSMKSIMNEFEKCIVLCSICHRELHSPNLEIKNLRKQIDIKTSIDTNTKKEKGKPKCIDCGVEINYTYKRCRSCKCKHSRIRERPDISILKEEISTNSESWCAKKYGVSRSAIRKWVKNS